MTSIGLVLACTRLNPAFDDDVGDGGSESPGESDAATTEGTSTTASTTASTTDSTTTQAEEGSTSEDPLTDLPMNGCQGDLREGLQLGFGDPVVFDGNCPDMVERHGLLVYDPNSQSTVLSVCDGGDLLCQGLCEGEKHPLAMGIDISAFAGSCVSIQAYKAIENLGDICSWGSISMFLSGNSNTPLAIAVTHGVALPPAAGFVLAAFPMLEEVEACTCAAFGINEACCVDNGEVHFYEFVLPNRVQVAPGDSVELELQLSPYVYEFKAVQAQQIGSCNAYAPIETSWALAANF